MILSAASFPRDSADLIRREFWFTLHFACQAAFGAGSTFICCVNPLPLGELEEKSGLTEGQICGTFFTGNFESG
jgi:hypothetical protein